MISNIFRIIKKEYHALNRIELSRSNLLSNYSYLSSFDQNFKIAPVLKSNAYGHGIVEIGKILDSAGAPFICVDSLHEAYQLYRTKIKTPVLIMGYIDPENLKVKRLPFSYAVYDLKIVQTINDFQKGAGVHIKVDTGMSRLGITLDELPQFLKELKKYPNINIEGFMSHFASVKNQNDPLYKSQLNNFIKAKAILKRFNIKPKWLHIAASEAVLNPGVRSEVMKVSNMARVGKAVYGYSLNNQDSNLKPVLKLITKIVQIKQIKKGSRVGYDGTFTAQKDMLIGMLPIGYNDGADRRLSNKGFVLVDGTPCPYVGRISMNISTISLDKVKNPFIGQEVVIFSDNPKDPNSIVNCAKISSTIPHDLLVRIVSTTRRVVL